MERMRERINDLIKKATRDRELWLWNEWVYEITYSSTSLSFISIKMSRKTSLFSKIIIACLKQFASYERVNYLIN